MSEDERRTAAIYNFYDVYRELQKYDSLRMHLHTVLGGETLIEIYRYRGEIKEGRILRVTQDDEVEAYEKAADEVKNMLEQIKKDRKAG